jgi:uncharacterized protein YndB with AHSA1/START domain
MARIVFELDIEAQPERIVDALDSERGIAGWWTRDVTFAGGPGSTMTLGFPVAPRPFELRVDEVSAKRVRWSSIGEFPPHWQGTDVAWTLRPSADGNWTTVHFAHDGWASDEGPLPNAAMTWGTLMTSLKSYVETGAGTPLFDER